MDNLVVIKTFVTRIEAEIVRGLLETHGIKAIVTADDEGGLYPYPSAPSTTWVKLLISKKDIKKAKKILKIK